MVGRRLTGSSSSTTARAARTSPGWSSRTPTTPTRYAIPSGTTIPGGGYLVLEQAALGFELDAADAARLFAAQRHHALRLVHLGRARGHVATGAARTAPGRSPRPRSSPRARSTTAPGDLVTEPWPGGATIATADVAGQLGGDISGLAYDGSGSATPGVLWAVDNGAGALLRLLWNGSVWTSDTANGWSAAGKSLKYLDGTGTPDTEGMTLGGPTSASGIYTATERNNAANGVSRLAILRYDVGGTATTLDATNEWSLTADLPAVAPNLGIEDIAYVPDSYLTANGFLDESTSAAYNPADLPQPRRRHLLRRARVQRHGLRLRAQPRRQHLHARRDVLQRLQHGSDGARLRAGDEAAVGRV